MSRINTADPQFASGLARRASLAQSLAALNVPVMPDDLVRTYMAREMRGRSLLAHLLARWSGYVSLGRPTIWIVKATTSPWPFVVYAAFMIALGAYVPYRLAHGESVWPPLYAMMLDAAALSGMLLWVAWKDPLAAARLIDRWKRRAVIGYEVPINMVFAHEIPKRLYARMEAVRLIPGVRIEALTIDLDPILLAVRGRLWWRESVAIGAWNTRDARLDSF